MTLSFDLPYIHSYSKEAYKIFIKASFDDLPLISSEKRSNFHGSFANHNRFFSNGDKPLVGLINFKGIVHLTYEDNFYEVHEGSFVFFDDNVKHSWLMQSAHLEVYYYRQSVNNVLNPVYNGDYCLDSFF